MAENTTSNKRLVSLDFLKTIAAFLTVFYHFAYYKLDYGFSGSAVYYPNFTRIIMCIASCCVPLFFMVNGALMFQKERSIKQVYLKMLKILVLTAIWSFAGFPRWFFITTAALYFCFPVLQWIRQKWSKGYALICCAVFVLPFVLNLVILILNILGKTERGTTGLFTAYSMLYFLLGPVLNGRKGHTLSGALLSVFGLALVVAETTIYTNLNGAMYDGVNAAFPTVGALLLSCGLFLIAQNLKYNYISKGLSFFGSSALYIYLGHMAVINTVKYFFGSFSLNLFTAILGSILICTVCAVIGKLLSRIPYVNWLIKI